MPLPRFFKLSAVEQRRLLAAATAEFAAHGYDDASVNRLLARAKISKGALYYYFSDKDDLYATVVERAISSIDLPSGPDFVPTTAADFWPAIGRYAEWGFQQVRAHPKEMKAIRAFQRDLRRHRKPAFENAIALVRARFRTLVEAGQALGCVRGDLDTDLLVELLDALDAVIDARLFSEPDPGAKTVAKRYAALSIDLGRRLVAPTFNPGKERRS
jgi:AcrR family transcriptional regulator